MLSFVFAATFFLGGAGEEIITAAAPHQESSKTFQNHPSEINMNRTFIVF